MNTLLHILSESPYLIIMSLIILVTGIYYIIKSFFDFINIQKHGWPPVECDIDSMEYD